MTASPLYFSPVLPTWSFEKRRGGSLSEKHCWHILTSACSRILTSPCSRWGAGGCCRAQEEKKKEEREKYTIKSYSAPFFREGKREGVVEDRLDYDCYSVVVESCKMETEEHFGRTFAHALCQAGSDPCKKWWDRHMLGGDRCSPLGRGRGGRVGRQTSRAKTPTSESTQRVREEKGLTRKVGVQPELGIQIDRGYWVG